MAKRPNFGPDFGSFDPNLSPKIFYVGFTPTGCLKLLQGITVSTQFQGKLTIQTQENGEKNSFWA